MRAGLLRFLMLLCGFAEKEECFPQSRRDAKSWISMFKVFLSGHLKEFSGGRTEIELDVSPGTVGEALVSLWGVQAALRDRILNEQGEIRQHVNVFYDGRDVKKLDGLSTSVTTNSEIHIFNAVSGG